MKRIAMAILVILFGLGGGTVLGQTLRVPFDFSQSEIGIDATVNGEPLYILLDTGVDPSPIDLQRAEAWALRNPVWLRCTQMETIRRLPLGG